MSLFKSLRGKRTNLPSKKTDGYAYFCVDDGTFHIDYTDDTGKLQRKQINAKDAETLNGASLSTVLNANESAIPTCNAVSNALKQYAPLYTYGTSDMTEGTSKLTTGKLYLVYE